MGRCPVRLTEERHETLLSQAPDEKLEPAFAGVVKLAVFDEDVEEGVCGGQHLCAGHVYPRLDEHRRGCLAEASPDPEPVAQLAFGAEPGHEGDVVDFGVIPAAGT